MAHSDDEHNAGRAATRRKGGAGHPGPDGRATLAYALLVLATFFWGGNMVAGRAAAGSIPPMTLTLIRWGGATLILLAVAWPHLRRDWPVVRAHGRYLALLALVGIAGYNALLYLGLSMTTAVEAGVLQSTQPLLIGLWSFALLGQRLTGAQVVGILLSFVGVLGIVTEWSLGALLALDVNTGALVILFACSLYALYSVLLRWMPPVHWSTALVTTFALGSLILLPFVAAEIAAGGRVLLSPLTLAISAYVAVFPSILSYLAFMRGIQTIGPNRAGPFLHLVPLFAALFAFLLLGERLHLYHLASFGLIVTGIAIASRGRRPAGPA